MNEKVQYSSISINDVLWTSTLPVKSLEEKKVSPSSYVIPVQLNEKYVLLFHGLTGAVDIIETSTYNRLFCSKGGKKIEGGTPRIIGGPTTLATEDISLYERGYFLSESEEYILIQELNDSILQESKNEPMCFFLAPTNFCAVGCTYCIEAENPKLAKRISLDTDQVESAFDAMNQLMLDYNRENGFILLFGGEPMQRYSYNTVIDILNNCRKSGLKIFCFTSGLDLERYAPLLGEYTDVVMGVCVTLDGRPTFHNRKRAIIGGFKRAVRGINLLIENNVPTMVRTNVSRDSFEEIPWLKNFYAEQGWWNNQLCSFELNILTNHGNFENQDKDCPTHFETASFFMNQVRKDPDFRKFRFVGLFSSLYYGLEKLGLLKFHEEELGLHARVPKMYGCPSTGAFTFTLDADGSIRMCNEQVGSKDASVGKFWPSFSLNKSRVSVWEKRTPDVLDLCKECNYRFFCGGGCSLRSMREEGITSKETTFADLSKGICANIQADFQQFYRSLAEEIINTHIP